MPQSFLLTKPHKLEKANFKIKTAINDNAVVIRQTFIGLNQQDCLYQHNNAKAPLVPGTEAVGTVETIGQNVRNFKLGDRVGYCHTTTGAYCTHRVVNQSYLHKIPDEISDETAVAIMFKGAASYMLTRQAFFACPSSFIMIYGITSGIGYLGAQWLRIAKSIVIGTASRPDRISIAQKYQLQDLLLNHNTDFIPELMSFTNNIGVIAILDPIGQDLYQKSLQSLSIYGALVNYGSMSGALDNIKTKDLEQKSLYITCPKLKHYQGHQKTIQAIIKELFTLAQGKKIIPVINKVYHFDEIPQAYDDLRSRRLLYSNIIKI